jgi:hypothetical protein
MAQLTPDTPLYNHPLPEIEKWLTDMGCEQDRQQLNCWYVNKLNYEAEISLEIEELTVCYLNAGADGSDIKRSFPYSLSRRDIEDAVFSGP